MTRDKSMPSSATASTIRLMDVYVSIVDGLNEKMDSTTV